MVRKERSPETGKLAWGDRLRRRLGLSALRGDATSEQGRPPEVLGVILPEIYRDSVAQPAYFGLSYAREGDSISMGSLLPQTLRDMIIISYKNCAPSNDNGEEWRHRVIMQTSADYNSGRKLSCYEVGEYRETDGHDIWAYEIGMPEEYQAESITIGEQPGNFYRMEVLKLHRQPVGFVYRANRPDADLETEKVERRYAGMVCGIEQVIAEYTMSTRSK